MSMFVCTGAGGHMHIYLSGGGVCYVWDDEWVLVHVLNTCTCMCRRMSLPVFLYVGVISGEYTRMSGLSTSYTRVHSTL